MKKSLYILGILVLTLGLSGCVKYNANIDIKKDKSMDFSIIYAMDTQYFGDQEILTSEDRDNLTKEGFEVSNYEDGTMKGFTISRSVKNIDDLSTEKDEDYSLSGIMEEDSDEKMFKVEKGFFKNKYTANFKFDSSDSGLSTEDDTTTDDSDIYGDITTTDDSNIYNDTTTDDTTTYDDTTTTDDTTTYDDSTTIDDSTMGDFSNMTTNMDLSLNVTLPYSALSNNATSTKNDNKTLSWNLQTSGEEAINFEFELYNLTNIYLTIGAGLIIILIIIIIVISKAKRKKKATETTSQTTTNEIPQTNTAVASEPTTMNASPAPEIANNQMAQPMTTPEQGEVSQQSMAFQQPDIANPPQPMTMPEQEVANQQPMATPQPDIANLQQPMTMPEQEVANQQPMATPQPDIANLQQPMATPEQEINQQTTNGQNPTQF